MDTAVLSSAARNVASSLPLTCGGNRLNRLLAPMLKRIDFVASQAMSRLVIGVVRMRVS